MKCMHCGSLDTYLYVQGGGQPLCYRCGDCQENTPRPAAENTAHSAGPGRKKNPLIEDAAQRALLSDTQKRSAAFRCSDGTESTPQPEKDEPDKEDTPEPGHEDPDKPKDNPLVADARRRAKEGYRTPKENPLIADAKRRAAINTN